MKVLFISSGNSKTGISSITLNQGKSLEKIGIDVHYLTIKGKGIIGYSKNILPLRKFLKNNKYDLIHAHFSLSAFVASLAGAKPLVVSLMGWNVKVGMTKQLVKIFNYLFWDACIVKSRDMKQGLGIKTIEVIPNGVDFEKFKPMAKEKAQSKLGWNPEKLNILFAADPKRPIKNYQLAEKAVSLVTLKNIKLHVLDSVPNDQMAFYYNACDVALLTSIDEGSPNVIKEAMACNCPIVSTNVGDVKEVINNTKGCFICSFDAAEIANKLEIILRDQTRTNGRENIKHLKSEIIAQNVKGIYLSVLNKQ